MVKLRLTNVRHWIEAFCPAPCVCLIEQVHCRSYEPKAPLLDQKHSVNVCLKQKLEQNVKEKRFPTIGIASYIKAGRRNQKEDDKPFLQV